MKISKLVYVPIYLATAQTGGSTYNAVKPDLMKQYTVLDCTKKCFNAITPGNEHDKLTDCLNYCNTSIGSLKPEESTSKQNGMYRNDISEDLSHPNKGFYIDGRMSASNVPALESQPPASKTLSSSQTDVDTSSNLEDCVESDEEQISDVAVNYNSDEYCYDASASTTSSAVSQSSTASYQSHASFSHQSRSSSYQSSEPKPTNNYKYTGAQFQRSETYYVPYDFSSSLPKVTSTSLPSSSPQVYVLNSDEFCDFTPTTSASDITLSSVASSSSDTTPQEPSSQEKKDDKPLSSNAKLIAPSLLYLVNSFNLW